jgi:hypothetical protein
VRWRETEIKREVGKNEGMRKRMIRGDERNYEIGGKKNG